ncbi:MAG: VCBS repeat-containing protein [Anaerolineales bacterium]|nr:VCBS repeat-containing protein [Anaerolineales bacterium]
MDKSGSHSSAISPPAGTGMAAGMGESFSLDLNSGQGNFTVPFELPDGVAGFKPTLKLEYSHGNRNGAFGLGWRLPLRQIDRRLDFGTPLNEGAAVVMEGGVELRRTATGDFRPVREAAFSRYLEQGDHWEIIEKDGRRYLLGLTAAARIADPDNPSRVQSWLLEREEDVNGNRIDYEYDEFDGYPYLVAIRYARFVVRLSYETRPDVVRNGRAGFARRITQRCNAIALHLAASDQPVRTLRLDYEQADLSDISLLRAVQLTAHGDGQPDVAKNPLTFGYNRFDGRHIAVRWVDAAAGAAPPPPLSDHETALLALDDLPLPGILSNQSGRQFYWPNDGAGGWGHPRPLSGTPFASSFAQAGVQFIDMEGSGTADMLVGVGSNPLNGYYPNAGANGFAQFRPYPAQARVMPPFESGRVRLYDIEGDGVVDALYSAGRGLVGFRNHGADGWATPTISANVPDVSFDDPLVFLADMTGDGMPDIVRVRSGAVDYWLNLGHGRFGEQQTMANSPRLAGIHRRPEEILLIDVDGDGCSDLVRLSADGIALYINRSGQAFAPLIRHDTLPIPLPGTVRTVDLDGHAARGLLYNSQRAGRTGYLYLSWDQETPNYLLNRIDNGIGQISTINYQPLVDMARQDRDEGRPWATFMPFPLWLVSATREEDQTNGRITEIRYRYHDGHFDPLFRRFQGFAHVDKFEIGDESRADLRTAYTFLMNQAALPGHRREHAHLDRMLSRVETFSLDGSADEAKPIRIEETEYDFHELERLADGTPRVFVFAAVTRKRYRERSDDERVEEMRYEYDQFGNVVREIKRGFGTENGTPVAEKRLIGEFSYATNPAQTIFKPARIVKRNGANELLREMRRRYDGLPLGQLNKGLQTSEEEWLLSATDFDGHYAGMDENALGYFRETDVDGNAALFALTKATTYTAEGNRASEQTGPNRTVTMQYDSDKLHIVREVVNGRQNEFVREPIYGKPTEIHAHNGAIVRMSYDAFGRTTSYRIADDSGANPTRRVHYDDNAVPNAMQVSYRIDGTARLETVSYYDGGGKELQNRVERAAGEVVVSGWLEKNPWNQTRAEFEPTLATTLNFARPDTAGRAARRTAYDGEGRPVQSTDYNGGISRADYRPFELLIFDALDSDPANPAPTPRRERMDVWNERTAVIEPGGIETRYEVGLFGELLALHDSHGPIARYQYDQRGNRLTLDHREAGQRQQWFDSHNQIVRTLDGEGNDVRVTRDGEGRLLTVSHNGTLMEQYQYDDSSVGGDGRLAQVHYAGGVQRFVYDARGRMTTHEQEVGGQTLTLGYEYNDMGKPTALSYPDGTRIERSYYRNGMTRAIDGIIDEVIYNARNLPTTIRFANGVTTTLTYEAGPGWVATQRTVNGNGTVLEEVTLDYDQLHRLIGMADTAPGAARSARYGYDERDQLRQASGSDSAGNYSHDYDYLNGYNLHTVGESGWTLEYNDAQRPDRMDRIQRNGQAPFDVSYNANGNVMALPGRRFAYNFKNQLTEITLDDGTVVRYEYDFRGQRTRRTATRNGQTSETLFVGDLVEVQGGQQANFVIFGQMRIAVQHMGNLRWIHRDRLGSTSFFTDPNGTKIAQIAYNPYGTVRQRSGNADHESFAAHPVDLDIGLVFMGRRWYASEAGRFLSPDPLFLYQPERAGGDVKQLRLYSYVANDPLNKVDPTGLSFWSVVGAIVGVVVGIVVAVAVVAAFATGIGFGILAVVGVIGLLTVSYIAASANQNNGFGEFMRGFMIGFNAGMNAAFLTMMGAGALGVVLGVINFLAAFDTIANSEVYQGILGWSSWLMPMSWLATAIGLIFFIINGLLAIFTLNMVAAVRIESISVDWSTGTIITTGGALFLPGFNGGYNLGNFAYVTPGSSVADHETGHTLNVAAFGSIFHFIGAIDENVVQANPADAYAERLAESNDPATTDPFIIPMWV